MKLKSLRFEIETSRGTSYEIYLDEDGEITKVDLFSGEFWPEDLSLGADLVERLWNAMQPVLK